MTKANLKVVQPDQNKAELSVLDRISGWLSRVPGNSCENPWTTNADPRYREAMKILEASGLRLELAEVDKYLDEFVDLDNDAHTHNGVPLAGIFQFRGEANRTKKVAELFEDIFEGGEPLRFFPISFRCDDDLLRTSIGNGRMGTFRLGKERGKSLDDFRFLKVSPETWEGEKVKWEDFYKVAARLSALGNREDKLQTESLEEGDAARWLRSSAPLFGVDLYGDDTAPLHDLICSQFPKYAGDTPGWKGLRGRIISQARQDIGSSIEWFASGKTATKKEQAWKDMFGQDEIWDEKINSALSDDVWQITVAPWGSNGQNIVNKIGVDELSQKTSWWLGRQNTEIIVGHKRLTQGSIDKEITAMIKWFTNYNTHPSSAYRYKPRYTKVLIPKQTNLSGDRDRGWIWIPSSKKYREVG